MVASGGAFDQPGLLEYLNAQKGLKLRPWPRNRQPKAVMPAKGFEVAFGTALQALGQTAQPVSLLPDDYRRAWQKRVARQKLELASLALLLVCAFVLAFGSWYKLSLISRKTGLLEKLKESQEAVAKNDALASELLIEYEGLRPLFAGQQNTLDTLKTLALLQQSRSNRNFWCVLLADQQTYFSLPALSSTNKTPSTNIFPETPERSGPAVSSSSSPATASTNVSPAKPGLIAELCIPGDAEGSRRVLSQFVKELKQKPLFSKVDLLSDDLRRNFADPKVIVPERDFVLALDFAVTDFQPAPHPKKPPGRLLPKRAARANGPASEELKNSF